MTALPQSILPPVDSTEASTPVARRYHRHVPGLVFIAATLVVAVGAINSQNNLLFVALGLCLGALLVSGVVSGSALMGVRVERRLGSKFAGGGARIVDAWRPDEIAYTVGNANRLLPAMGLVLEEILPPSSRPPGAANRGLRFWRFRWTVDEAATPARSTDASSVPRGFVPYAAPRGSTTARVRILPVRRGRLELDGLVVWTTFPFGLARKSALFRQPETLLVRPAAFELKGGVLEGLLSRGRRGEQASDRLGPGFEFLSVREHRPGDALKHIAWKPSARSDQLIVRQTATQAPRQAWVVLRLDDSVSASANELALVLASSLIHALAEAGLAVGLSTLGGTPVHAPPRPGVARADRLRTDLALADWRGMADTKKVGARGSHREGLVLAVHAGQIDAAAVPDASVHWVGSDVLKLTLADDQVVKAIEAGTVLG
jgi:uncharacterized protein (DUF58 family)